MRTSMGVVIAVAVVAATAGAAAQEFFKLASAQVIESTDRPPVLRLSANGPIAFRVEPAAESGVADGPSQLVLRLYGVTVEAGAVLDGIAPFSVSASAVAQSTRLIVRTSALPAGQRLQVRAGMRTSELEIFSAAE